MAKEKSKFLVNFEYYISLLGIFLIRCLPLSLVNKLSSLLACLFFILDKRHRERAVQHIMHAGIADNESDARCLAKKNFINFSKIVVEMFKMDQFITEENAPEHIKILCSDGIREKYFNEDKSSNSNMILVTGHCGNWELIPMWYSVFSGIHLLSIMRPFDNPRLSEYFTKYRQAGNFDIVNKEGAVRPLLSALKKGESVGFVADQHAGQRDGVETVFFGHPASSHTAPAKLHLKTGVPIVPTVIRRVDNNMNFEYVVGDAIVYETTDDKEKDIQAVTQLYTSALEELIRTCPEQWTWAHRRWLNLNRDRT